MFCATTTTTESFVIFVRKSLRPEKVTAAPDDTDSPVV